MKEKNKQLRSSNIELLRIVLMFMIISAHYVSHGIVLNQELDPYELFNCGSIINKMVACFCLPGGKIGVACFFMITGYFFINKQNMSINKIVLQVFSYSIILFFITVLMKILFFRELGNINIFENVIDMLIIPISSGSWWFISAYVYLVLLAPLINKFINKLNENGFRFFIIFYWIVWYCICQYACEYKNIYLAIFFYCIGGYLNKFKSSYKCKKIAVIRILFFILIWSVSSLLYFIEYSSTPIGTVEISGIIKKVNPIIQIAVIQPIGGIMLIMIFNAIDLGQNIIINKIAKTTLGIYILHDSGLGRNIIWNILFNVKKQYLCMYFPIYGMITILAVFIICSIIDYFKSKYIDIGVNIIFDKIKNRLKIYEM